MKKTFFWLLLLVSGLGQPRLFGQITDEDGKFLMGLHVGVNYLPKGITALPETIIPAIFSTHNYSTENIEGLKKGSMGFTGGANFEWRGKNWLAVGGELMVANRPGGFRYTDIEGLSYSMRFDYWFVGLGIYGKGILPTTKMRGLYFKLGAQPALNVHSENRLFYDQSLEDKFGKSEPIERELRTLLDGKMNFSLLGGAGYEHSFGESNNGFFVETSGLLGIGDVLQTRSNGYGFRNPKNKISSLQATVGFLFTLND